MTAPLPAPRPPSPGAWPLIAVAAFVALAAAALLLSAHRPALTESQRFAKAREAMDERFNPLILDAEVLLAAALDDLQALDGLAKPPSAATPAQLAAAAKGLEEAFAKIERKAAAIASARDALRREFALPADSPELLSDGQAEQLRFFEAEFAGAREQFRELQGAGMGN